MHIIPDIVFVIECRIFPQKGFLQLIHRDSEVEKRRRKSKIVLLNQRFKFFHKTVNFETETVQP